MDNDDEEPNYIHIEIYVDANHPYFTEISELIEAALELANQEAESTDGQFVSELERQLLLDFYRDEKTR